MNLAESIILGITILTGILTIIEKQEKLKWKPLSWLFNSNNTAEKIDILTAKISCIQNDISCINERELEHYKKQAKILISDFASDLRRARPENATRVKTKSQFISILNLCDEYIDKGWNTEVRHDAEFIKEVFDSLKDYIPR